MKLFYCLCFLLIASSVFVVSYGPDKAKNWSEYITVRDGKRHLFYWFFESRNDPDNSPFVLWMTGGPGCSGMLALLTENGPYHVEKNLSLSLNPYSWTEVANVMWIDQPVGAGFSYDQLGDIGVVTEKEMAEDMYELLQDFLKKYPKYQPMDFFITGESYAGHYIPALSAYIHRQNVNLTAPNQKINLKALAIGNGLVDPLVQYRYYAPFAFEHGIVSAGEHAVMEAGLLGCLPLIKNCKLNSTLGWLACFNAYDVCNLLEIEPVVLEGVNPYDVREQCKVPPLCYDFSDISKFLAQPDVMKALGTTGHSWNQCNRISELRLVLAGDWMINYATDIPELLASNHSVLIYAGAEDFICNWLGNSHWVAELDWEGKVDYNKSANTTWKVDGAPAGTFKSADGLTFLKINNAGHMVPRDQPKAALDMLTRFINGQPFA